MWSFFRTDKVLARNEDAQLDMRFEIHVKGGTKIERGRSGRREDMKNTQIRVVVSQKELKQILNFKREDSEYSSVEHLLSALQLKGRVSQFKGNWRPALESIPEEH